jgi:hypothetical protein
MSHVTVQSSPLSRLLSRLAGFLSETTPDWRDSKPDSIIAPSEAPPQNRDYPDWLGHSPEIQRLLR